jgi:hypothetical protein
VEPRGQLRVQVLRFSGGTLEVPRLQVRVDASDVRGDLAHVRAHRAALPVRRADRSA